MSNRKPYPSDVSDEDVRAFVAPYLTLVCEDAPLRTHDIREVTGALSWIVRAGASWRSGEGSLLPAWCMIRIRECGTLRSLSRRG
jgi:hypothetical protein